MPSMLHAAAAAKLDLGPSSSGKNPSLKAYFAAEAQQFILSGKCSERLPAAAIKLHPATHLSRALPRTSLHVAVAHLSMSPRQSQSSLVAASEHPALAGHSQIEPASCSSHQALPNNPI